MKKVIHFILKLLGKLTLVGLIAFAVTFVIYMTNAEKQKNRLKRTWGRFLLEAAPLFYTLYRAERWSSLTP